MRSIFRDSFAARAAVWPERIAIIDGGQSYTFAALEEEATRAAHLLAHCGVGKGDTVGILLTNRVEFAIAYLACQKLGAAASCLNWRLDADANAYSIVQEEHKALVYESRFSAIAAAARGAAPGCRFLCIDDLTSKVLPAFWNRADFPSDPLPAVEIRPEDICTIIHTSGTTGRPKGAAISNEAQVTNAIQYALEMGLDRGHVGMSLAPVAIGAATNFFLTYLFVGAAQVLIADYDKAEALAAIGRHRVSEVFAVPTQMHQMADWVSAGHPADTASLRLIRSGGSALTRELVDRVRTTLGCEILNTYGTTESCTALTACHTGLDPEDRWESIGKASYFQEVRIVKLADEDGRLVSPDAAVEAPGTGQLINRGPQAISAYHRAPELELPQRDGWQFTRDVVRVDADGYLYPVDRMDNVIISGGENMYPQEIEFQLSKHPRIVDVAVCGVPDPEWGQKIKALIVPADDGLTAADVERYCIEEATLARHMRPRIVQFVDTIPRNILGKIARDQLG